MKLKQLTEYCRDEAAYLVTNYKAQTFVEFVNEVLEECPDEWGVFRDGEGISSKEIVEYKYGELLGNIPEEYQYRTIQKILATGGWSCMNYAVHFKE